MPGGRPSKLTPAVQKRLCDAIRTGNYLAAACKFARIDYSTFTLWMNAGREATEGEFFEFFNAVELAKAEAEIRIVAEWQKHMPESYQACRDFLARRFPKRWGPKDKHEVSGPGGKPLEVKHDIAADLAPYTDAFRALLDGKLGNPRRSNFSQDDSDESVDTPPADREAGDVSAE